MARVDNIIGGEKHVSESGRTMPLYNPATGEQNGEVGMSTASELDKAVEAAKAALPGWANLPPLKRANVMFKFKYLVEQNFDRIAEAISSEHGKTHDDALGEVQRGLEVVDFACGIPDCRVLKKHNG